MAKRDKTSTTIETLDPKLKELIEDGALDELIKTIGACPPAFPLPSSDAASGGSVRQIGVSLAEAKELQKLVTAAHGGFLAEPIEEIADTPAESDDCTGTKGYVGWKGVPIVVPIDPIGTLLYYLAAVAEIYNRAKANLDRTLECRDPCVPRYEIKTMIASRPYESVTPQRDPATGALSFSYVWMITIMLDVQKHCVREF